MEYLLQQNDKHYHVELAGTFTFSDNSKFRHITEEIRGSDPETITLDIHQLQFIDSAALGMLLLLHDEAQKKNICVTLSGASGQIKKMLQLSNFQELFNIENA
ncbi:MAG: STAS domain-containing protein [Alphaproteobacteria bacterium]|nr:STAS domain-containing protein [Alphaproteobacteria bacterium]